MRIKEITISRQTRVNLGNYEGVEVHTSMTIEFDELDDQDAEVELLRKWVEGATFEQVKRIYKKRRKKASDEELTRRYGSAPSA